MSREKTIDSFFKRKEIDDERTLSISNVKNVVEQPTLSTVEQPTVQPHSSKSMRIEQEKVNIDTLIYDPGKRPQIWDYLVTQQDEIHRAYIKFGPYQFIMDVYLFSSQEDHPR